MFQISTFYELTDTQSSTYSANMYFFNVCILRLLYIKVTLFTTVYFLLIINHSEAILCGLLDK